MGYYIYYTFPCSCTSTAGDYPARPAAESEISLVRRRPRFGRSWPRPLPSPMSFFDSEWYWHWTRQLWTDPYRTTAWKRLGGGLLYHYTAAATTTATTDNNNNNNNDIVYIHDIGITQYNYSHNNYYASYLYTRSVYRRQFDWFPNADRLLQLCLIRRAGREVPLEIRTVRCLWFTRNICLLRSPWFPL